MLGCVLQHFLFFLGEVVVTSHFIYSVEYAINFIHNFDSSGRCCFPALCTRRLKSPPVLNGRSRNDKPPVLLEIKIADRGAAKMGKMRNAGLRLTPGRKYTQPDHHHHQIFDFYRKQEPDVYDSIRIKHRECHQHRENRTRSADRRNMAVERQQERDYARRRCRSDEIELEKFPRSPLPFQIGAEHPESEHVEEDVEEAAMQEHVSQRLPESEPVNNVVGHQPEKSRANPATGIAI